MTALSRLLLALLLLLHPAALGAFRAYAQDDDGYDDQEYEPAPAGPEEEAPDPETLSPYGSWMDDGQYGRVWEPSVSVGWAPYVDGYWAWTPYGWTWASDEPWAWTFHYGRWAALPVGWVWVPGSVWGPAWVDWFWGDGFVGWAPLSPFATQVTVINQFVFVHERDFCSRNLARTVVDHHLVPNQIIHRWQHRDPTHERPPGVHHIEQVSERPIMRLDHKPPGSIAPRRFDRPPQLARPGVEPGLGGARRGDARLGRPWQPGSAGEEAVRPPLVVQRGELPRAPRLARPEVEPRLGTIQRGGDSAPLSLGRPLPQWTAPRRQAGFGGAERPPIRRAEGPPVGRVRPVPLAIPGGAPAMPAPTLLGARGPAQGHGFGPAPRSGEPERLRRGGGGQGQLSTGSMLR